MKATHEQRETARDFLYQIEEEVEDFEHGIKYTVLDDWTDDGSFQACIVLKASNDQRPYSIDTNLRRLTPAIKRAARKTDGVSLTGVGHPDQVREWNADIQKTVTKGHEDVVSMVHFWVP